MKFSIGFDHRGYKIKHTIINCLEKYGFDFIDRGTNTEESVDYPDYAFLVAKDIIEKKADFGILVCMSGIGMSIAANKIKGIRAAYIVNADIAINARKHNNANIIVLGSDIVKEYEVCDIINNFTNTEFEGGRHKKRIDKIEEIEKQNLTINNENL